MTTEQKHLVAMTVEAAEKDLFNGQPLLAEEMLTVLTVIQQEFAADHRTADDGAKFASILVDPGLQEFLVYLEDERILGPERPLDHEAN